MCYGARGDQQKMTHFIADHHGHSDVHVMDHRANFDACTPPGGGMDLVVVACNIVISITDMPTLMHSVLISHCHTSIISIISCIAL